MSEPRTKAGRALLDEFEPGEIVAGGSIEEYILAIEAEALDAARTDSLDVERLAAASVNVEEEDERVGVVGRGRKIDRIAAEYARLDKEPKP